MRRKLGKWCISADNADTFDEDRKVLKYEL